MNNEKIAIVGLGIIAPKALNKDQFWQNVTEGRNCIGEVPADRWDWKLYFSEDHKAADKTYSKIGGFIEGFKFDSIKYKIPPQIATQISRLQQMTIEAVRMALEDSGYDKKPFDPRMTAAVIGNAMGATRKEMTDMRVYKFYNEDILKKTAAFASLPKAKQDEMIREFEEGIDNGIIKITEDTMPGELANVTAGRIANVFNFNGPNMTMDAACASSMAALDYAVLGLRAGKFDMAVAGGADDMMSPPAYVKFCKIGALSADGSYSFDTRANGFVMAEAVSVYVLKRLSDAQRDGDKIYALINSVGASSDGKGKGITAPNPKGQKIAIENAFAQVDYSPAEVDFVEAHGTATKVGDAAEVQVLGEVFGPHMGSGKKLGLTSVKSQIGHSKAAAGAVSIAKTALAIYNKILPTSINYKNPNPGIDLNLFKVIDKAEPWNKTGIRRANVSSFGFGGTNFHVTMEEYTGPNHQLYAKAGADAETPAAQVEIVENSRAPFANLQGEAVTFTGATPADVIKNAQAESAAVFSKWPEAYPLAAYAQPSMIKPKAAYGVSVVAKSPKDLMEKVEFMAKNAKPETWTEPPLNFKLKGVYTFKTGTNQAKVGLLFPGQGSQYVDMMRDLAAKYQVVQETFNEADVILDKMIGIRLTEAIWSKPGEGKEELAKREAAIKQTQLTQPSMMTADIAMYRLMREFGIKPDMAIGHSLGEYAAATAAGIFTFENGLRAVTSRAKEMSSVKVADPGKMASIAMGCDKVDVELKKISGYVICANKNCPLQTVIAGEAKAVEQAVQHFKNMGVEAGEIPVSHAFHSEIVAPAMGPYRNFLQNIPIKAADMKILSNVTADFFPTDPQGIYDMLIKQMTSPVEFIKQLERMYDEGVRTFIECGPKRVLSAFATATLKGKDDVTVLASNHPKRGGITELNDLLANMTALGIPVNWNGKLPQNGGKFFNPYYQGWAMKVSAPASAPVSVSGPSALPADKASFAEKFGFNFNPIAVSGIAGGTPGTWDKLFREHNLDEILAGKNMIEQIPGAWREKQIEKNIIRVVKSPTGNHSIEKIDSVDQAIKLSARSGSLDIEKEFGLPHTVAKALDTTFKMAIGAGVLALQDAGLPLIHYYKKTTTGSYLPEKWALPEPVASETGVVFASAFPVTESLLKEVTHFFNHKYAGKTAEQLWEVYHRVVDKLPTEADKAGLRAWLQKEFAGYQPGEGKDPYSFSQNFLLKVIPIADSQFAQWVGAKGPTIHVSAACASTTQAVHIAESWIRAGKCKRVVVIAADDITNETIQEWTMPGFLASGTATTKDNVSEAALPFDRRRHGLIAGSGAVGMVIEDETLTRGRGMKPLARLLLTECANSAFHATRLDTEHVATVMSNFVKKIERIYGLKKEEMAPYTMFMSHETYTPARGGSASAEVKALRRAFGDAADKVVVSNVKGFTGHTMGASLEDVIAVRALNTGIIPPIANYKEPDPELAGINLSKGGHYDLKYALRFAAGFGSHMAMAMTERVWKAGESRFEDQNRYNAWVKEVSGDPAAELEVVFNTLRVKDKKTAGKPPAAPAAPVREPVGVAAAPAPRPAPVAAAPQHYAEPKPAPAHRPAAPAGLGEETVKETILAMITDKTGYPKDMLELDLDMEADLGIDTVKQAELFAAIREHYSIPRKDNISLKDYPTIRHCIKFVMGEKGGSTAAVAAAPVQAPAPAVNHAPAASGVSEDAVKENILNMITEKTGYPKDMLELDLDMEADLGIDTVKQAELFAAMRENYSIPRRDNLSLKDYPTIRHCIKFVMEEKAGSAAAPVQAPAPQPAQPEPQHYAEPKPVQAHSPATSGVAESDVKENILNMIADKTGYPKDMLELDLDMEADLGIDTVKQAELFAAMREHYSIPRRDNLSLKDYPTIRHCINFVLEETAKAAQAAAPAPAPAPAPAKAPAKKSAKAEQPDLLNLAAAPEPAQAEKPAERPVKQDHPKRHIRHVPAIIPAPVEQEVIKKLAPKRPVAIFAEDLDLAKAFRAELNKHRADSYIFTPAKTKVKDAITVDFKDVPALEQALADFANAHPDTQGIVYLPGCMVKSLSQDTAAFDDLKRYALPLFLAAKHLAHGLNKIDPGCSTFMAVVTTLDGGFGYRTKDVYDPIYGAIHGPTLCLRKEFEKSAVKLLDFEPSSSNQAIVQKTFYEILYSDKRLAIGYADGKRWTLVGKPATLDKSRQLTQLEGKNVLITGGGRGLGAMFARMLAEQHKANILILDIMEIGDKAKRLTGMNEAELKAYKMGELWNELKAANEKPTPALLEKEFTRLKDAADMHKNMEAIRALGVKVHYYRCDLTDTAALRRTMENVKTDLGPIDGLVHFAGLERSKLAVDKATEEFVLIFNVKADSAINMWKTGVVKEKGFWVMASSIAGKFGNLGQTDYAAASDYIAKFCVSQQNKGVRALSVDMTGYAQIGMGARPGVEAFLKSQEMEFLYPEEGMQALLDELAYGKVPEIILSGSLGKLDWDKQLQYEPGFSGSASTGFHFAPKTEDLVKGESLAASKEFSMESDPYLADHSINGTPYVPGVMGLETFAEAATVLTGANPKALTDVRFAVPIKLLRGRPADVRVKGLVLGSGAGAEIRLESDFVSPKGLRLGQTRTHFKGTAAADAPSKWTLAMRPPLPKTRKYKADAATIYKTYFHGPSFQVLDGILSVDKNSVLAVFKRPSAPLWKNGQQKLVFHPLVFEALFQACGWRDIQFDRAMALPDAVGAAIVYDNEPQDPDTLFLYGVFKGRTEDNRSLYDAWAFDADYKLVAELRDYAMIPTPI